MDVDTQKTFTSSYIEDFRINAISISWSRLLDSHQFTSSQLRYVLWERVKEMLHHCFSDVGRARQGVSVEFELGIDGEFFDRP